MAACSVGQLAFTVLKTSGSSAWKEAGGERLVCIISHLKKSPCPAAPPGQEPLPTQGEVLADLNSPRKHPGLFWFRMGQHLESTGATLQGEGRGAIGQRCHHSEQRGVIVTGQLSQAGAG